MMVILTEEESMKVTLRNLINARFPAAKPGDDWLILTFSGKKELEKSIPKKLRAWNYGTPHFVILMDGDNGDCHAIKQRLIDLASPTEHRVTVRIVCQALESWFIGDPDAVSAAYPKCAFSSAKKKYRDPDAMGDPSRELSRLTSDHGKVTRAMKISEHLAPDVNRSRSFQVFVETLSQHFQPDE